MYYHILYYKSFHFNHPTKLFLSIFFFSDDVFCVYTDRLNIQETEHNNIEIQTMANRYMYLRRLLSHTFIAFHYDLPFVCAL